MTSLRRQLLTCILAGLLAVLAVSALAVFFVARSGLRTQHDQALIARARTFAAMVVQQAADPMDPAQSSGLVFEYAGPLDEPELGVFLRITAVDGAVGALSPGWPASAGAPMMNAAIAPEPILRTIRLDDGSAARVVVLGALPAHDPDEAQEESGRPILVEVIGRTAAVERAESALLAALLIGGVLAVTGTGAAVWLGVRRGLVPIRRLGAALDALGPGRLTLPADSSPRAGELRPIAAAVEGLLARLRSAIERERRFIDAAAHELRTPIAELRAVSDVADRWPEPERLRRAVTEARAIASEMESLLESLLMVARGGRDGAGGACEPVALLPLARAVANGRTEPRARGLSWQFEGDEGASWMAPRGAVVAIVRNLIDNAGEYTPDGGSVRVCVRGNGARASFEIENGPVILAPGDTDRLFEPFWRADKSRSQRGHRGLGLSIVAALAEANGLKRDTVITGDGRLRITLMECEARG